MALRDYNRKRGKSFPKYAGDFNEAIKRFFFITDRYIEKPVSGLLFICDYDQGISVRLYMGNE
jgi:hypothetical protein